MLSCSAQGFASGLMLSISFMDLAHNAINSIGFLKANLWVSMKRYQLPFSCSVKSAKNVVILSCLIVVLIFLYIIIFSKSAILVMLVEKVQFFGGVILFAMIVNFIPEPNLVPSQSQKGKSEKVSLYFSY